MSKYIVALPLGEVTRICLYVGKCGQTVAQVRAWAERQRPGERVYLLNGGTWTTASRPDPLLKVEGNVLSSAQWSNWGYGWDQGPDIAMVSDVDRFYNFLSCVPLLTPWDGVDAPLSCPKAMGGVRGRSAIALTGDKLLLYCAGDATADAKSPEALREELYRLGAETAVMLDGGGSSQCDFDGQRIASSRKVHNLIVVWAKGKEETPMDKSYKVVLDPGHGVETAGKRSPDGSYLEHEFALDMAYRVKDLLELHGVSVTLTRKDEHDVSLADRVKTANGIKDLDLFVSLHSNASGDGTDWTAPDGFGIYTSAAGEAAGRNQAAKAILAQAGAAGIKLWGNGLFHDISLYVLKNTTAPAVLIEHGFHTNREETGKLKTAAYRDELARVDCKGILDYLGIEWRGDGGEDIPWYVPAREWAMERGITDGTRPGEACTRAEVWQMLWKLERK